MGDARPIGVFDSGIGGLTVVREIMALLPNESIVYFGDTARVPYGTKSPEVVRAFALQDTRCLMKHDVKMVVAACHTASSVALDDLKGAFPVPVHGVIEPGVRAALEATRNNTIGVIGTRATILTGTYERKLTALRKNVRVESRACPLFVPLVEEGWLDGDITRGTAAIYLDPLKEKGIDTLILGCTHYPLLKSVIRDFFGNGIRLIDSAEETSKTIRETLQSNGMENPARSDPERLFFVSDIPAHFQQVGEQCLGMPLGSVHQVNLEMDEMSRGRNHET
jgi:glutamate racemase